MKKLISLVLVMILMAFSVNVSAATANRMIEKLLVGINSAEYNDFNDSSPFAINYAGGAATITITGAALTITGAAGVYVSLDLSASAYDTSGEVYDLLVATHSGVFTVVDEDMLRSENSNLIGDVSSQDIGSAQTSYSVLYDTAGTVCTAGTANKTQVAITPPTGKRIRLFLVTGNADIASAAATDIISVFSEASGTHTETMRVKSPILTDSTDKSVTLTPNPPYGGLDFKENERVIVRTQGDEAQDAGAGTYITYLEW